MFGATNVRPVPAIIAAQALNGVVLPGVACFLLVAVNDRRLMGSEGVNGAVSNLTMALVTLVTLALGTLGVVRASTAVLEPVLGLTTPSASQLRWIVAGVALSIGIPLARIVVRLRRH